MPTSQQEAERIVNIIGEYIDYETAAAIMHQLYDEVGQHTENESLAVSLEMLSQAYSQ